VRLKFRVTDGVASRILCLGAMSWGLEVTTVYVGSYGNYSHTLIL